MVQVEAKSNAQQALAYAVGRSPFWLLLYRMKPHKNDNGGQVKKIDINSAGCTCVGIGTRISFPSNHMGSAERRHYYCTAGFK